MNEGDVVRHKFGKFVDGEDTKVIVSISWQLKRVDFRFFDRRTRDGFLDVPEQNLEVVDPALAPGQEVVVGRHPKDDDGKVFNWNPEMEILVGTKARIERLARVSRDRNMAYYKIENSRWIWLREALIAKPATPACVHAWVNVGFSSIRMACKHCGCDQP